LLYFVGFCCTILRAISMAGVGWYFVETAMDQQKAAPSMTETNADAARPEVTPVGPVTMAEALERWLPHCNDNPHKVAARLDTAHREGEIRLLGGDVPMAPRAIPAMMGIVAHVPSDGRAFLYVEVRKGLAGDYPIWDGKTVGSLEKHHQFWTFERKSFDAHLPVEPTPDEPVADEPVAATLVPDEPKNRRGRPADIEVTDHLIEALVYVGVSGKLPKSVDGQGGLRQQLESRLGSRCAGRTRFYEIFSPIYERIEREKPSRHMRPVGD
jgi:hypothetical protein